MVIFNAFCKECGKAFESRRQSVFCSIKCKRKNDTRIRKNRRENIKESKPSKSEIMIKFLYFGKMDWFEVVKKVSEKNITNRLVWSNFVRERDGKCQVCGSTHNLEAHHIKPKSQKPELSIDVNNGITLCHECHIKNENSIHKILGVNYSSKDFNKWIKARKSFQ